MKRQMITMFLNKISEAIIVIHSKLMSDLASLDQHQKKAHVIELYNQGELPFIFFTALYSITDQRVGY